MRPSSLDIITIFNNVAMDYNSNDFPEIDVITLYKKMAMYVPG